MKTFFSHIGYIGEMKRNFHILRFQYLALAVVKLVPKNLNIIDTNTGQKERVRQINTLVQCTIEKTNIPLVLQEYRNSGDPECIAQLATADMDLDFISGKLVINHKLETGGEVVFIPNDKKKPNKANAAGAKKQRG
jgi:hypothetical protein